MTKKVFHDKGVIDTLYITVNNWSESLDYPLSLQPQPKHCPSHSNKAPQNGLQSHSSVAINRLPPSICIVSNQAKEVRLRRQDPGVWLISMEIYAAHKQTRACLIRAEPLIHCQHPAHTSPGLFLVSFTKQMYLIKRDAPE